MEELLQQLLSRDQGGLVQFIKYAIAGGIATAVHMVIFHLAAWKLFPALRENDWAVIWFKLKLKPLEEKRRALNSMLDNLVAFLFSNLVAYVINVLWVFEPGKTSRLVEIGKFYAVSGLSTVIGTSIMGYLIRRFGMKTTYAFIANLISALLINYAARKFWIFKG